MALSSAERQRRYREKRKNNPEKVEEAKRKDLERYHAKKKLVRNMTPQEHARKKKQWKLRNKKRREKKKALRAIAADTPPSSPAPSNASSQRGRRVVRRDRARVRRENILLKNQIEALNKKLHKYKKRLSRDKKRNNNLNNDTDANKYAVLTNAIKEHYNNIKSRKQKRDLKKIFHNQKVSESKSKTQILRDCLGKNKVKECRTVLPRSTGLQKKIKDFYLRDDVSRATAGKKETLTKHKIKEQKRYLLDSMKNLFKAFLKENEGVKCHYSYFAKFRPFYVVPASIDGRDTCTCKVHANMAFTAITLFKNKVIDTYDMNQIILQTVCSVDSLACMNGTCTTCASKKVNYDHSHDEQIVNHVQWVRTVETIEKDGKKYKVTKHAKATEQMTVPVLVQKFEEQLKSFKQHAFNIKMQYKAYRQCIDNLTDTEIALHIDFSENYACKFHTEIQAHHFGGSRNQVSLHTVVMYSKYPEDGQKIVTSFTTVSPNTNHGPAAIWAHLDPILGFIKTEMPAVKTVHVFSDGPATQYKQKVNFYLMSTRPFVKYGLESITWNFFESGHGKGAADGLGGCLKRMADSIVANGHDIPDSSVFFEVLKDRTKIKLFFVDDKDITQVSDTIPSGIVPLKGTMKVHQMFSKQTGILSHRVLSCFCEQFCSCYNVKTYQPLPRRAAISISIDPLVEPNTTGSGNALEITSSPIPSTDLLIDTHDDKEQPSSANSPSTLDSTRDDKEQPSSVNPPSELLDDTHCDKEQPSLANPPSDLLDTHDQHEEPLTDITNFNKAYRQRIFDAVYSPCTSSDDENEPLSSVKEAKKNMTHTQTAKASNSNDNQDISENQLHPYSIKDGTHVLVKIISERKTEYTYIAMAKSGVDAEGEVRVVFYRHVGNSGKLFKLVPTDISDVNYENLLKIIPKPKVIKRGKRLLYEFEQIIDVFEM